MKLFSTSCETLFLGWDAPLLPRVVATLVQRYAKEGRLPLGGIVCVLPSSHGVRRLAQLIRHEAANRELLLEPPRIITVGQLAERLYKPPAQVASEFEQTLAWAHVLRASDGDSLSPLIPVVPAPEPIGPWLELAGTLRRMHEELSASRITFGDVVEVTETDAEKRRWTLLQRILGLYNKELADAGLCDPFAARRQAVLQNECRCERTTVLIGTSDLSDALIEMLRSLDSPLIAMVAAPESEAGGFDEFGCVDTNSWLGRKLPLEDRMLIRASDMLDQSEAVSEVVADFANTHSADQVTVGVTDESQVGPIEVQLRGCGVPTYRHLGWTVARTAVGRLLDLTSAHLQRQTWQSLASLVRHADVHAWISKHFADHNGDWLTELDHLLADHFPQLLTDPLPPKAIERSPRAQQLSDFVSKRLAHFSGKEQSIAAWSLEVRDWLRTLYGDDWLKSADSDSDSARMSDSSSLVDREAQTPQDDQHQSEVDPVRTRTWLALSAASRVIDRFSELNEKLDLSMDGATAVEMLSARLADVRVLQQASPDEVEILGWLDLALEDAPALVVNGLNHPFVPRSVTSDPFLPGSLRAKLPVADNDRRYARDVYAMQLMLSTRCSIRFIVGSSAGDGSPTPPSRLLAAAEPKDIARRIRLLLDSRREAEPALHHWDEGPERAALPIPALSAKAKQVKSLSVTAFRDYLICPYRFYLRHVLRLRPLDDSGGELAANQFGDLIHGALESYGMSKEKDEKNPVEIEKLLRKHLHDYARDQYTEHSSTAVQIQVAQAERRLQAVALAQAERVRDGWTIDRVEASVGPKEKAVIKVGDDSIGIKGRFDRIDRRMVDGKEQWAILDYKTHGHPPEKKHLRKTDDGYEWIDLQLPLYRMMVPFLGIDAKPSDVALGYFNIGEKEGDTKINEAKFDEDLMKQADDLIRDCVRKIRAAEFQPTQDRVQYDDYDMILQTGVASRLLDQTDAMIGEEAGR